MQDQRILRVSFLALFFLSGISGLIYQIVWTRHLVLVFGNTLLANSTVLAAFMAGLAAGSFVLGEAVDRRPRRLLRLYAQLEAGIGLFGLVFPSLLAATVPLYRTLYHALDQNLVLLNLFRFVLCFLLILVPTFLMGGTLPVLLKRFVHGTGEIGHQAGRLYGLNTAGAVAGCVAAGYWLLGSLGMRHTVWVAVAINLVVAVAAMVMARGESRQRASDRPEPVTAQEMPPGSELYGVGAVSAVLAGIAVSGFCALAYEVLWARMLNLFLNNNVYSFTATVATFLAGIALGSLLYARFLAGVRAKLRLFAGIQIAIGLLAYLTPFLFSLLQGAVFSRREESFTLLKTATIMLAPTLLMGIAMPLAMQICQWGKGREGRSVGAVYACNTVGSILGAFVAGFVLVPLVGLHRALVAVSAVNLAAGFLVLFARARGAARPWAAASGVASIVLLFAAAPSSLFRELYLRHNPNAEILHYKEGKVVNVVVYDFHGAGYRDLHLNGIEEASSRLWHVQLFKLLGILPVIAHEQPQEALMIAFGAGMSAGACIDHVTSLDCVDLNPDIGGPAEIFRPENRGVIDHPKLNVIVNDGRNELLLSPKRYSLIISDATNPKMFDSWTLYTREFYELTKSRLLPGGIFAQWLVVPLPEDSVQVILNTFRSVYPHMSLWCVYGSSQCLMMGTPERLELDLADLSHRLGPILESTGLADYGVGSAAKLLSFLLLGEDEAAALLEGFERISTDDLPYPQFQLGSGTAGTRAMLDVLEHQAFVDRYVTREGVAADGWLERLEVLRAIARRLHLGFLLNNRNEFLLAAEEARLAGHSPDANVASALRHDDKRRQHFEEHLERHPEDAATYHHLGYVHAMNGELDRSIAAYRRALELRPGFANARANLSGVYLEAGAFDEAEEALLALRDENPTSRSLQLVRYRLGLLRLLRRLSYSPQDPELHAALSDHYARGGEVAAALTAALAAAGHAPEDLASQLRAARYLESLQLAPQALEAYRKAAALAPEDLSIRIKVEHFERLRRNRKARQQWLNDQEITLRDPRTESTAHPRECDRARAAWNDYEFEGSIERDQLVKAARLFERAIHKRPDHLHALLDAATLYEHLGDFRRAAELVAEAQALDPSRRGLEREHRRLSLSAALADGGEITGGRAAASLEIGQIQRADGSPELAARTFERALAEGADGGEIRIALAAAYREAGRYEEARRATETALGQRLPEGRRAALERQLGELDQKLSAAGRP